MKRIAQISTVILAASLVWLASCRDAPRDNPFDPEAQILLVSVLSPPDSSFFISGELIDFRVIARTGYENLEAGSTYLWRSNISGILSIRSEFTLDSLSAGTHRITVFVEDSLQGQGSTAITVTVEEITGLAVRITSPPGDTSFIAGGFIEPAAEEYIPPGTEIAGRTWLFGEGSGISDATGTTPGTVVWNVPGSFRLSYQIVDTFGRTAADTVVVTVLATSEPPGAEIVSPSTDTTVTRGDSIYLKARDFKTVARIAGRVWEYTTGSGLEAFQDSVAEPGWRKFQYPGFFKLIYRVSDLLGAVGRDSVIVTVEDTTLPPEVEIISPDADTALVVGDSLFFKALITPDYAVLESQMWNYDAASGIDPDTAAAPGWRKFEQVGTFNVVFTIRDPLGREAADTVKVTVSENQPPTAEIISPAGDITIGQGISIEFSATDDDPDGEIVSRAWSWDVGSGITPDPVADSTDNPGSKTFLVTGIFTVRYTATDNHHAEARDSVVITVQANQLPTADITSMSDDTTITAGDSVPLEGVGVDPDGTMISTQWSYRLESDPHIMLDPIEPPAFLALDQDGTYWVYFTVTDSVGVSTSDSARVVVVPKPFNNLPTASITSPSKDTVVVAWSKISFAGEDSDQDGQVVARQWSNGTIEDIDPTVDTTAATGPKLFNIPGTFRILYTVTDDRGDSYSAWRIVTVLANFHPTAQIVSPDRDVTISAGGSITFSAIDSDPDGEIVSRIWDYGDSGIAPDSVAIPGNRTFNIEGVFEIIYTVVDNVGISWSDSLTVTVTAP